MTNKLTSRLYIAVAMLTLILSSPIVSTAVQVSGKLSWNT